MSAAPTSARIAAQTRYDARTLLANGEQLLVAIVLPALALVGLVAVSYPDLGSGSRVDIVAPGVLALAIVSTAFTGQAIGTAFDRRSGVLRLLGTTPLGRGGLLAGRVAAVLVVECIQWVALGGLAVAMGWRPDLAGVPLALLALVVGTAAFVSLALLVAGTLRAEAVLAVANLLWVLFIPLGLLIPADRLPGVAADIAPWTPGGALGELLRSALADTGTNPWPALGVLLAWSVAGGAAAVRWFRWSD